MLEVRFLIGSFPEEEGDEGDDAPEEVRHRVDAPGPCLVHAALAVDVNHLGRSGIKQNCAVTIHTGLKIYFLTAEEKTGFNQVVGMLLFLKDE